jgi:putative ABC transport system permease protein
MLSGVRSLSRKPAFAVAAITTVAVGIGANTALFGVIYSVLIRPLPFRDPGRLVQIWETHPALPQLQATAPDYRDWRAQARSFEDVAAYTLSAMNNVTLLGEGEAAAVHGTMASSNLFPLMGIVPLEGRAFTAEEEHAKQGVVLISENLWQRKFGGDRGVFGRQIRLGPQSWRVIGLVPQRQAFPEWADFWMPLSWMEEDLQSRRKFHPLEVMARLKPGVSVEAAQVEMTGIARQLSQAFPETNATIGANVLPLVQAVTGGVRPALLLAWGAVGLVLLIACANLAHLFLARVIERRQEIAIREALGAGTWDLLRQLLGESLAVAAIGGTAGIWCAAAMGSALRALAESELPRVEWRALDGPVWLFAAGITLVSGVLFGLPACWQLVRRRSGLSESGRAVVRGRSRIGALLMAGEVAMALLVLSGAALLARNFAGLLDERPGFEASNVSVVPKLSLREGWEQSETFLTTKLAPALRAVPGVSDVGAINSAPMSLGTAEHSRYATRFGIEGRTFEPGSFPVAQNRWGTPEVLRALGVPLKSGRWLHEEDSGKPQILVNETLARRYFPGQDAVGKRLLLGVMDPKPNFQEIVGVVGDVRDFGLDEDAAPTMYGVGVSPVMTLVVKTAGAAAPEAALRAAIRRADEEIPITEVMPLERSVAESLARKRFALTLLAVFGAMAAFLTAGGVYGLLTQSVNARLREIGVRAAVGASPGELVRMIFREAAVLMLPGLAAGGALSVGFARVMKALVTRVSPADPVSIVCAAAFLVVVTLGSAWAPARRAADVDPASALRAD